MDGRRAYAENFVRYYWRGAVVDGEFLRGVNLYVLGIFTYLVLYWAQMGRHYVTVCFLIALVVFNEIMVARWKRRGGELDFFQRHLLQGYLAAVGSLSFMLYPVVLVEQSGNVTLTLLFLAIIASAPAVDSVVKHSPGENLHSQKSGSVWSSHCHGEGEAGG